MKHQYSLLSAALLLAGAAHAQGTELFFSEYDEGAHMSGTVYSPGAPASTGNERAIEIYNPTNNTVNLNPYSIRRYSNGSTAVVEEERLFRSNETQQAVGVNSLNPRSTYVIANGQSTLPVIRNAANQFSVAYGQLGPTVLIGGGAVYFNGNDAVALVRYPVTAGVDQGVIVDLIGVIGEDPKQGGATCSTATGNWSGNNPADGTGTSAVLVSSANQSLVRRATVSRGVTANQPQNLPNSCPGVRSTDPGAYNIATEWMMYSTAFPAGSPNPGGQNYNQLGNHNDYVGPYGAYQTVLGTLAKFNANISVYPNPAQGTATVEIKDAKVGSVVLLNSLGQRISAQGKGQGQEKLLLDISGLKAGLYFVQVLSADGQTKIYKELVVQ
ncbi:T9SS type A sorting domain-containing protein [Hymenobacter sp.]|uniref:T9SS type A sorting domain-containing protein n=1 Tax=Hymenobacter sp. TaxID=1898978 RepID=UPI00286BCFB2|nr:T9SS type A sorting domain-containing protein [Hymenobacter sp.]